MRSFFIVFYLLSAVAGFCEMVRSVDFSERQAQWWIDETFPPFIRWEKPDSRQLDTKDISKRRTYWYLKTEAQFSLLLESGQSMKLIFSEPASLAEWDFSQTNGSGLWLNLEDADFVLDTHSIEFTNSDPAPIVLKGKFLEDGDREFQMKVGTITRWLNSQKFEKGMELPLERINLKQLNKEAARDFYHLPKSQLLEFEIDPDCSFSVITYSFLQNGQLPEATYKLELQQESGTQHYLFQTSPDQENSLEADGDPIFLNRERRLWIPPKEETHKYTLTSDQDLLIRIEAFCEEAALTEATVWEEDLPEPIFREPESINTTPLERYSDIASNNLVKDSPMFTIQEIMQHPTMDLNKKLRLASVIRGKFTGYRSVLPSSTSHKLGYQEVNYSLSRLETENKRIIVRNQENQKFWYSPAATQKMSRINKGNFEDIVLTYTLPPKDITGQFRFQLHTPGIAELRFEFDDETSATAYYRPYEEKFPLALTQSEVATFQQSLAAKDGTLPDNLLPLLHPASITLDIPKNAKELKVVIDTVEPEVLVAADYLDSNPYFPDETVYLSLLETYEGDPAELFASFLKTICVHQIPEATGLENKLLNSWMPLLQLLQSRYLAFHRGTTPLQLATENQLTPAQIQNLQQKARQAEAQGDLYIELDALGEIVHNSTGHPQQQALYRISAILNQLDDAFLATQFLKGLLLEQLPDSLRLQVSLELKRTYEKEEDYISHLGLVTSGVVRAENTMFFIVYLMDSLLIAQYEKEALLLQPFLENSASANVIQAALKNEWKQTLESTTEQLESDQEKQLVAGIAFLQMNQIEEAEASFEQAGHRGQDWLDAIEEAKSISAALLTDEPGSQARWLKWEQNHPGPRKLVNSSSNVISVDIVNRVVSTLNGRSGNYFRATREKPLKIGLPGNALIKITLRPEFESPQSLQLQDGLFHLQHEGGYASKRIFRNLQVTDGLCITGSDRGIGRSAVFQYSFPPGYHVVNLHAGDIPVYFKVEYEAPVFRIPILPKWRPNTEVRFWHNLKPHVLKNSLWRRFHYGGLYVEDTKLFDVHTFYSTEYIKASVRSDFPKAVDASLSIPTETPQVSHLDRLTESIIAFENRETSIKSVFEELNSAAEETIDPFILEAYRKEIDSLTAWSEINNVPEHDGLFFNQYEGWSPQSPHLRVRKSLIGPVPAEARILFDDRRQAYQLSVQQPLVLRFGFQNKTIPYSEDIPLEVEATCTGKDPQVLALHSGQMEAAVTWELEPGVHTLEFRIIDRQSNQFLAIFPPDILNQNETANVIQKKFYRATNATPLQLRIEGPLTLRSDILHKDGRFESRVVEYPSGVHTHRLQPTAEESPWLCKVYQRSIKTEDEQDAQQEAIIPPQLVSLTLPTFVQAESTPVLEPVEYLMQNHAWQVYVQGEIRNIADDEPQFRLDETFYEVGIEYLRGYPRRNYDYSLALMTRFRENGGNLSGLIARDRTRFDPINATWTKRLIFNVQNPGGSSGSLGVDEYRLFFDSRLIFMHSWSEKFEHTTEFGIFAQHLSMDDLTGYIRDNVDLDLFSLYKHDHTSGIGVGKRFFRYINNHTLYGSGFLWSNSLTDGFSLERISLNVGWEGYWKELDWDLRLRSLIYQEDDDRNDTVSREQLRLDLSYTEWRDGRNRWVPYLRAKYDLTDQQWAGFIGLNYRWGRLGDLFKITRNGERQLRSHFQKNESP